MAKRYFRTFSTSNHVLVLVFFFQSARSFLTLLPLPPAPALPDVSTSSWAFPLPLAGSFFGSSSQWLFFPVVLPLKCGTSRCWIPSISEKCYNLSNPSALVKMSATCRLVRTYRSMTVRERTSGGRTRISTTSLDRHIPEDVRFGKGGCHEGFPP